LQNQEPAIAFEIAVALEKSAALEATAGDGEPPRPEEVVKGLSDAKSFFTALRLQRLKSRAYSIMFETRQDALAIAAEALLWEEDPRCLDQLAGVLVEQRPQGLERFFDQVVAQPRKAPAGFVWITERAAEDAELREKRAFRLLKQILAALSQPEMASFRVRLQASVESGGTVPRLFQHLNEEQAAQAHEAVSKAAGLESFVRRPLLTALELRFPGLQKEEQLPLYATSAAISQKRDELRELLEQEIPANRRAIEEARALGDLRENFEYKSARQRHEYLAARAAMLHRDLARVRPFDLSQIDGTRVRPGTCVELEDEAGSHRMLTILGPWESDPARDVISYESDLAQTMVGKRVGEPVTIDQTAYLIKAIQVVA
jgi:transcription elongation GreA/GreB family factor